MEFPQMALDMLFALVVIGTVMGDGQGGEPLNTSTPRCPLSATPEEDNTTNQLLEKARECVWNDRLRIVLKDANTTQSYLSAVKDYCDETPISRQCLAETKSLSELCVDELGQSFVNIQGKLMLQLALTSCADEGIRLAAILEGVKSLAKASENVYKTCFNQEARKLEDIATDDDKIMGYSMLQYKFLKNFKNCLVDSGSGATWRVDIATSLLEDILKEVVCVQEPLGPEVLCETIYTD